MVDGKRKVGTVGMFDDPRALVHAAEQVRDAGYSKWNCHTPYPVHGLDQAMGLKESPVPTICLTAGFLGVIAALLMQGWMDAVDYPVRIGGKPMFSWPAFVPITFEMFVLFAAVATMGSILVLGRLGRWHSPLHDSDIMSAVTSSRFALVLDGADPHYTEDSAVSLLKGAGCEDIRPLYENEGDDAIL